MTMEPETAVTTNAGQLRAQLLARREEVLVEIRAHPPAIPACDAHFNHLLQRRDALGRELGLLQDILEANDDATRAQRLADFLRDSDFLSAEPLPA